MNGLGVTSLRDWSQGYQEGHVGVLRQTPKVSRVKKRGFWDGRRFGRRAPFHFTGDMVNTIYDRYIS
jgi:hypothetical protein